MLDFPAFYNIILCINFIRAAGGDVSSRNDVSRR
jgi:hypothetical protein